MITIVSGLPRSGTSLMMQMLAVAGLEILSDGVRVADANNPRGYYEWERIKQLPRDPSSVVAAEGKVVKIVAPLLSSLPPGAAYRIIFMERDINEVVRSQAAMIHKLGTRGPALSDAHMAQALQNHLAQVRRLLASRPDFHVLNVSHFDLIHDPRIVGSRYSPIDLIRCTKSCAAL